MSSNLDRKLSFSNLSYKTTEKNLVDYFSIYGSIKELYLYKDDQDQSLRQGYLIYKDCQSIDELMLKRPHILDQRQIHVQRSIPIRNRNNHFSEQLGIDLTVNEIFISRLCSNEKREMFINYFQAFGKVLDCRVCSSSSKNFKQTGYAFVRFHDYDTVDRIILARPHIINSKYYHLRKCIPREYNYIISSIKPLSQSKSIWRYFSVGLINTKTYEIIYPSVPSQQSKKESSTLSVTVDQTAMKKSLSNDFEIITSNSLSSSSISIVNSIENFTPLTSPIYSTTNIDHDDEQIYDLI